MLERLTAPTFFYFPLKTGMRVSFVEYKGLASEATFPLLEGSI